MAEEKLKEPPKTTTPSPAEKLPVGGAPSPAFAGRLALGWSLLCAFFWGATVYFLPPSTSMLWKPLVSAGSIPIRPALIIGAAVSGLVAWLLLVKFRPKLDYLKPGQGKAVRTVGYVGFLVVAWFAAYEIAYLPSLSSEWWWEVKRFSVAGVDLVIRYSWAPAGALVTTVMIGYHLFMNREYWAEFLIETQSELRKVNWPASKEWIGSSTVVVVVVTVVAFFLYFVDEGLSRLLQKLGIGF